RRIFQALVEINGSSSSINSSRLFGRGPKPTEGNFLCAHKIDLELTAYGNS
ncbi:unnamed protein product, partial [Adineta ricciae]